MNAGAWESTCQFIIHAFTPQFGEERDQRDATNLMFIHNLFVSTCFGHYYAHRRAHLLTMGIMMPETC
jgi:hypothetical protein